jgi:hypothetical protein
MERLKMKRPKPTVDLALIRRKYHEAVARENATKRKSVA